MERILEITKPPFLHIPENTHIMTILYKNESTHAWFHTEYFNIWISENYKENGFEGFQRSDLSSYSPFLDNSNIYKQIIEYWGINIKIFIENMIDNNIYLWIPIDMYYISNYKSFHSIHRSHRILVYGYDDETYKCADFFNNGYNFEPVTKEEFLLSYENVGSLSEKDIEKFDKEDAKRFNNVIYLFKKNVAEYYFDISVYKQKIIDYLSIKVDIFHKNRKVNLGYYDSLVNYFSSDDIFFSWRPLVLLKGQKIFQKKTVNFFLKNSNNLLYLSVIQKIEEFTRSVDILINKIIKYNIKNSLPNNSDIINKVIIIKKQDSIIMEELLSLI